MTPSSRLFVGITTWNSELLLPLCLESLRKTAPDAEVVVLDNESTDRTQEIVAQAGVRCIVQKCGQADALNLLAEQSNRPFTALIHADVVFVSPNWVDTVLAAMSEKCVLVSPEDIGCGPYTRPWGKNMPESSFMCFATAAFDALRVRQWRRRLRIPYFRRVVDFFGEHVTYNLPSRLAAAGLEWRAMEVLTSRTADPPIYVPDFELQHWQDAFGRLRYGLGNFYRLGGVITHYHNWYDRRVDRTREFDPRETLEIGGAGVPVAFLKAYTENFIRDYRAGQLQLPGEAVEHSR